jgi:hypothetical protein
VSLLPDPILERLVAGEEFVLSILVVEPPCAHPEHSPLTAYAAGCRCARCRAGVADSRRPRRARAHTNTREHQ